MAEASLHISKAQVKWVRSLQQKKVRDAEGVFVAEGDKCIGELMGSFELVLLVRDNENDNHNCLIATRTEIEQMSNLRTPQGSIAVFRKPQRNAAQQQLGLILALDGIQDPGNLGTIIRTCDWFGVRDIYCSRETADCYNPKVVQATMGALARVRIHYVDLVEWITQLQDSPSHIGGGDVRRTGERLPIYGTLLDGRNMYLDNAIADRQSGIIIMGNEGNGISEAVRRFITHPLYIPNYNADANKSQATVESLNVSIATAIVLAEFRRK